MEKKTILDYAKAATNESEKPVKHVSLKYDDVNKRVFAEVTISDIDGTRLYYVYNESGINYYLDCLVAEEHKSIADLLADKSLKISIDEVLLDEKGVIVKNLDGKNVKVTYNAEKGQVVFPKVYNASVSPKKEEKKDTKKEEKTDLDTKKKKRIKNIKILAGLTALVLAAGYVGSRLSGGKNDVRNNNLENNNNKSNVEDQSFHDPYYGQTDEQIIQDMAGNGGYIEPEEEIYTNPSEEINVGFESPIEYVEPINEVQPLKEYYHLGSDISFDDMNTQIQVINDECFKYGPTALYNLVYENDRDAIYTIVNMRNGIFDGICSSTEFLNNAVNYIFENGLNFDGKQIKSFDSLSAYSQYIVLVATQSVLQLQPNYENTTPSNYYNYDMLVNSFDYMVDYTYKTLTNSGKTY